MDGLPPSARRGPGWVGVYQLTSPQPKAAATALGGKRSRATGMADRGLRYVLRRAIGLMLRRSSVERPYLFMEVSADGWLLTADS
ncbi:MAG: hypothetical protein HW404_399 [Anaerolineales bacterium]|nr:hypothetical protein [Anaerolineales bacterium]